MYTVYANPTSNYFNIRQIMLRTVKMKVLKSLIEVYIRLQYYDNDSVMHSLKIGCVVDSFFVKTKCKKSSSLLQHNRRNDFICMWSMRHINIPTVDYSF